MNKKNSAIKMVYYSFRLRSKHPLNKNSAINMSSSLFPLFFFSSETIFFRASFTFINDKEKSGFLWKKYAKILASLFEFKVFLLIADLDLHREKMKVTRRWRFWEDELISSSSFSSLRHFHFHIQTKQETAKASTSPPSTRTITRAS